MRKMKKFVISLSAAALLAFSGTAAFAEDVELATEAAAEAPQETAANAISIGDEITADGELSTADRQSLATYAVESIKLVTGMSEADIDSIINPPSILSVPQPSVVSSVQSWLDARGDLGAFVQAKEHNISVTDDSITIESVCDFEKAEGLVTLTLDRATLTMSSMTFAENDKSLGKTLEEAALNTVMGIGIVFLTLLFLSFLISQFKHISKLEQSLAKKNAPAAQTPAAAPAAAAPAAPAEAEETQDDSELVAVIAAAVAAYEGTSADGFVVRSIKRSSRNNWQRA